MTGSCRDLPRLSARSVRLSPLRLPDEGPPDDELSDVRYAVVRLPDEGLPYRLSGEELPYWLSGVRLPDEELSAMRRAEFAALALSTALLREPYLFSLERTYSS